MKVLHINRHAKSSWKNADLSDFERPLNKRGKLNAAFMSVKFVQENKVDFVISSPAVRAKTTALCFATALGIDEENIQFEKGIYGAGIAEMIKLINNISNDNDSVIVFGHNPTLSELACQLDHSFNSHLVTCARVKIEFDVDDWSLVGKDSGRVVEHDYPRKYPEMEGL